MHWTRSYVGKPWAPNGDGPASFSCWGVVRAVYLERFDIALPIVAIAGDEPTENDAAIKESARLLRARRIDYPREMPEEGDIVLMTGAQLHCGLVVRNGSGRLGVLHSAEHVGVTWQPWSLAITGTRSIEVWRRS